MAVAVTVTGLGATKGRTTEPWVGVHCQCRPGARPRSPAPEGYVCAPQAPAQGQAPTPQLGLTLEI